MPLNLAEFNVGCPINDSVISSLIQRSENAVVCISEKQAISFATSDINIDLNNILNRFHQIDSQLPFGLPFDISNSLKRELGAALYCAITSENESEGLKYFDKIASKIENVKTPEDAKSILILSSFLATFILAIILIGCQQYTLLNQDELYLCMAIGSCGSFFSLLNRNKSVTINLIDGDKFIYIQSFIISITGALSGLVVYIFSNANIAFGFVESNLFTLLAICLTAGFSERLIPDLFEKVKVE